MKKNQKNLDALVSELEPVSVPQPSIRELEEEDLDRVAGGLTLTVSYSGPNCCPDDSID